MDWKEFEDPPCVSLKSGSLFKTQTKPHCWEFPGSSLVRTLHPHCWSPGFSPCQGSCKPRCSAEIKPNQPTTKPTHIASLGLTVWNPDACSPLQLRGGGQDPGLGLIGWVFSPSPATCNLASCSLSFLITKMRMVMPDWWTVVIGE